MMISSQKFSFCIWQSFTIKLFLTIWPILVAQQALAQVTDDFSDGDFTVAPAWSGEDSKFSVDNGQLRLQAPLATGNAYLSTPSEAINDGSWAFLATLDFNPSASNYARIYLVSDNPNLSGALNGYFIMLGGTTDEVSLYKQSGTIREKIIDGADGRLNMSVVNIRVRATRDGAGNWSLFSDINNTGNYISEGSAFDGSHIASVSFGVACFYTATRSSGFYFDDFNVQGDPFQDVIKPQLQQWNVVSGIQLELTFSEDLDPVSAETTDNYSVSNAIGNAIEAELSDDHRTVSVLFARQFPNAVSSVFSITGVKDRAGNVIDLTEKEFVYFEPAQATIKDIIITEIFSDPDPVIGLPALEYVEIFNRSTRAFQLSGWILTDGSSEGEFPTVFLLPGEYLIATADAGKFSAFGKAASLLNFPTLNNSGDMIVLKDEHAKTIDSLHYSDTWYHDEDKKAGGWALELIDPDNICGESGNWIASEDESGGSPGKQNSVYTQKPDLTGPKLLSAIPRNSLEIILVFDEKLNEILPSVNDIVIEPDNSVNEIAFANESLTEYTLKLSTGLKPQVTYVVRLQNVHDCAGNGIQSAFNSFDFGLTEDPDSLDVLVNEILFNPRPTGVDFVELVNNSNKYLNLKNWSLANWEDGKLSNPTIISDVDLLLKPAGYLVLTKSPNVLKGEYPLSVDKNFLTMTDMPSFNDDKGTVAISDDKGTVIDHLEYTDDLHSPFIRDNEGVSLERISLKESRTISNWKSASTTAGYATPGYVNSNARQESLLPDESVKIEPEIFSPLASYQNLVQINYRFSRSGLVATIKIIDAAGHVIKEIANNELLGTAGFFRWDGDTSKGTKARAGYYMVWFEVFNENGYVNVFKRRVAVAGQF